jgi:hypothetical protein
MAATQFGRIGKITIHRQRVGGFANYFEEAGNGIEIENLRFTFKVEKNLASEPNTCELTTYNLSEHARADLQKLPLRVRLEAGYETEGARLLFVGDVQSVWSELKGTDWETKFLLGDGARAFSEARVNRSYKPGSTVKSIIRDAAKSMGLDLPREVESDPALALAIPSGETVMGWASDELTRLLAPYGYSWSIQNGRFIALKDEQVRPGQVRVISQDNGMIGYPQMGTPDKKGKPPAIKVSNHLYPEIQPGEKIDVQSATLRGLYRVTRVTHEGDTAEGPWETEIEAKPQ